MLADVREHATCVMGASGNRDDIPDITISSWTLSRYRDPQKKSSVNRKLTYDFLLVTNSNFGHICYHFQYVDA